VQFYRQKPIGRYIVDFYAPAAGLVVELDGGQHFDAAGMAADAMRDAYLRKMGLRVLRFDDGQMLRETDAVVEVIWQEIVKRR
jgi:very-short-patch-repair endonuclease